MRIRIKPKSLLKGLNTRFFFFPKVQKSFRNILVSLCFVLQEAAVRRPAWSPAREPKCENEDSPRARPVWPQSLPATRGLARPGWRVLLLS